MADEEEDGFWILPLNDGEEIHVIHQSIESTDDVGSSLIELVEETSSAVPETNPEAPKKTKSSHGGKDKVRSTKSSRAWRYFEKETEVTARCTLCNQVCKHSGNTTNLTQHLTRKHALFCSAAMNENKRKLTMTSDSNTEGESTDDDITQTPSKRMKFQSQGKLTTIEEAFERTRSFKAGGKICDKLTNAILYMIAVDKMPLSTVENEGFRYVLKTAVPPYIPPSRKTVTRLLDARYDFLKERFIAKLGKAVAYSLTCDNWTDISNQSYLGVTVHYVTEELTMENGCIGVFPLNESHTAQYLTDTLNSTTEEFGLDHAKITAIVSDSAANIKKAIRDMLGADKHLPCFAHTVSHLVPSALVSMPVVREVIAKVKSIVTLTRKSVVASDELKKLQLRDGKTEGTALKFIQDVPTRWNSTLYMLERFLLLEQYVYPVMLKCPKAPDMLKREEINILKDVVSLMKPVERIIKNVSGDSYPTCSVIIPLIHCLEDAIRKYDPSTNDGAEFKKNLQAAIASRFKDFEHSKVLAKSTILDPRFKKVHFQSARAATTAISAINDKMRSIELPQTETVADALSEKENDPDDIWSYHDRLVASKSNPVVDTHTQVLSIEFKQYLNQQVIARDANPLEYWKSFKLAFPSMYALGVKYVSVVGTSVPSERLFSQAGDIKTDNRSRLSDEENSLVHGIVTADGLFDGTVITASGDEIYIEPTRRYVPPEDRNTEADYGTQHDNGLDSHHTIAYRSNDVATPLRNQQPCDIEILHKKNYASHDFASHGSNETLGYYWINVTSSPHQNPKDGRKQPKPGFYPKDARKKDPSASTHNLELLDKLYRERYSRVLRKRTSVDPKKTTCMLYLQADHTFFDHYKSEEACIEVMTRHVQRVNSIYRYTDFNQDGQPDNISFMIKRVKVHGEESLRDPSYRYTGTYGVEEYLELFSEEDYDAFCLSYMFTYRDFEKGTLGLAWTGDLKNAGGVCEKNGHYRGSMKSLNTGIITLLNYGKHVPPAVSHVTLAHEIGHNFGSPHDPDECSPGGVDGNFIMFARATSGDKRNNNRFSPCSLVSINPVLNAKARSPKGCFAEPQTAICGNGVVEESEECDCGWEEDCNDPCCHPQRLHHAPFEIPCRLTEDAVCSPSQGPCCTSGCTLRTGDKCRDDNGCRDASFCNGLGPQCPPSINKPNKTICNEEFVCYMGECTGSICLAYGLESCQCIAGPDDPPTKSCELCCKLPGEDQPCLSSFSWNSAPYEIPDMMSKPGTPCNDYNGYCDVFQRCREVDPSGPLATLRRLLLSDASLAQFQRWMVDRWYAVALGILAALLGLTIITRLLGKRADARLKAQSIGEHASAMGYPSATGTGSTDRDGTNRIGKIARIKRRIVETMKTLASPRKTKDSSALPGETRISKILCFVTNDRRGINSFDGDRVTKPERAGFDESRAEKGFSSQRRDAATRETPQWEQRRKDRNCETIRDKIVLEEPRSFARKNGGPDDDEEDEEDVFRRTVDSSRAEDERSNEDWPFIEFIERIYRGKTFRVRKKFDIGGKMRKIERLCGSPKFRCDKNLSASGSLECCVNQSVPLVSPDTPDTPTENPEPRLLISDLDVLLRES